MFIGNMNRNIFLHLLGAPQRYLEFLKYSCSTRFFPLDETKLGRYECQSLNNIEPKKSTSAEDSLFCKNLCALTIIKNYNVFFVVFPPALVIYALSSAVSNVLRYSLLMEVVGVSSKLLPLIIGLTDSALACFDVIIRIHGKWDLLKVYMVGNQTGPLLASFLHGFGTLVLLIGCYLYGCQQASIEKENVPAQLLDNETDRPPCSTFLYAIILYTIGSFIMQRGKGLLWNIWSQIIKQNAKEMLSNAKDATSSTNTIDFHGKMAQIQVLLRYLASSFAPLLAAWFLVKTNNYISYAFVAFSFTGLALFFVLVLNILNEDSSSRIMKEDKNHKDGNEKKSVSLEKCEVVTWSDMLPSRLCYLKNRFMRLLSCNEVTENLVPKDNQVGRFSDAFFHCGLFLCFTESVRSGYTRIICLRAATSDLTDTQLAQILSVVGAVAIGSFWLSDISDTNRRLAASFSFITLAIGHICLCLASTSSMTGFYISGIFFGLGEGISTGLRALVKQDYLSKDGPLGKVTEQNVPKFTVYQTMDDSDLDNNNSNNNYGKLLRRQVCNKIGIWADVTLVLNSIIVGVIGHWLGMRTASFIYGILGLYATYFCARIMPDTKPTFS